METSFQTLIACRGWHVYGKSLWPNPRQGEPLNVKKEESQEALIHDPHSIAVTRKTRARLVPDIVGHFPLEISRYVWFFIHRGGRVACIVHDPKYRRSPIPKGGLEIVLKVTFSIAEENKRYIERLRNLIAENYETPTEKRRPDETDCAMEKSNQDSFEVGDEAEDDELDINLIADEEILEEEEETD